MGRFWGLALLGVGTFVAIAGAAFVFITVIAPTTSPARMLSFNAAMFAVTGGVLAVVVWASRRG